MAVPRITPPAGLSGVGLPQPLAPSEAARIRRIFALQRQPAGIPAASAETRRLSDDTLLGHILADRMLRARRVAAPALADWLGRYADLPDACAIYAMLLKRLAPGDARPPAPSGAALASGQKTDAAPHRASGAGAARDAFLRGRDAAAERLGRLAWERSHGSDGEAAYVAGLAAWRRARYAASASLFADASVADGGGSGLRAGAAFWAARAHARAGDLDQWRPWMLRAASSPQTLHGMLARGALGLGLPVPPAVPVLGEADVEAIAATPQGRRAFALIQVGETQRAEAELRRLWPAAQGAPALSRAIFLVAGAAGLSDLVADLASAVNATEADLPVPALHPRGGFRLNAAMVYAVAHVESNFDSRAVSAAGAHGLMQLMPVAASALGHGAATTRMLRDPATNLKLGQDYLTYLSGSALAGDDLLRVLASYNSGPGAVQKWARAADADPVLFLETIPSDETRHFVQRTLTGLWGYSARFGLPSPSLKTMAAGLWPRFSPEIAPAAASPRFAALH